MPNTELNIDSEISNFKLIKKENLPEIVYHSNESNGGKNASGKAFEFIHISGARLVYLANEDPEKAFSICFKTLPSDNTGVFHIIEHSVLCGSRKFPVKEPFTNLLKSSMQTFLNAMTFPDKTLYPVASTNEKDLYNLIDVYMDAVLFPNMYKNKNIYYQEGGHPTANKIDEKWAKEYNGVVYNEMKGAYSEPQEYLVMGLFKTLFPKSCYSFSSGGEPSTIKKLNYEQFIYQHNKFYNLENAQIAVYGNLDIENMLDFLDKNYLSKQAEIEKWRSNINTNIKLASYDFPKEHIKNDKCHKEYMPNMHEDNKTCGAAYIIEGDSKKLSSAAVVIDALISSNESPLKAKLIADNIADDIKFEFIGELSHPMLFIECKNSKNRAGDKLKSLIEKHIKDILKAGISQDLLRSSISAIEFAIKEAKPECTRGVDLCIDIMNDWLYDKNKPWDAIKYIEDLKFLKSKIGTKHFDEIASDIFLNNDWYSFVEVLPDPNKNKEVDEFINDDEASKINQICKELEVWQNTADSLEDEEKIPVMDKKDIGKMPSKAKWKILNDDKNVLYYDLDTNGISYLNQYYPISNFDIKDFPYLKFLAILIGQLDTKNFTSSQLITFMKEKIGWINIQCDSFENINNIFELDIRLKVCLSVLNENINDLNIYLKEILQNTKFDNVEKIKNILKQEKTFIENKFMTVGHTGSMRKARAQIIPDSYIKDKFSGIDYYNFVKQSLKDFDKNKKAFIDKLKKLYDKVFSYQPMISAAGDKSILKVINTKNTETTNNSKIFKCQGSDKNLAYILPTSVNYVSMANDYRLMDKKLKNNGSKKTASSVARLDYLWNEVRVKNGAYGVGLMMMPCGSLSYYSFRDPHSIKTIEKFKESAAWLQDVDITQRQLDNYIISTVAKIDSPKIIRKMIEKSDKLYLRKSSWNDQQEYRQQIINTKISDIHEAGFDFSELCKNASICIFGGSELNNLDKNEFEIIDLFSD